jgi:membrane-associated phospholipid phosphatase
MRRSPVWVGMLIGTSLFATAPRGVGAQAVSTTAPATPPLVTADDAWIVGGFAAATIVAMPFDERLAEWMQLPRQQMNGTLKATATTFRVLADPGTVIISGGLWVAGRLSHHRTMADVGLHSAEAIAVSGVVGWAIKGIAGRARPRVNIRDPQNFRVGRGFGAAGDYQSFPSGHTLAAFSLASAVTAEAGHFWGGEQTLIGVLTYGGATLSGLSRMYNNAHWASDVVLGAGLGTLAGLAVVRWQHGHPGNWVDRTLLGLSVAPASPRGVALGFHVTWW